MNLGPNKEMPKYRCHKVVRAARITAIKWNHGPDDEPHFTADITLGEIDGVWVANNNWMAKNSPAEGGYLVQYEDGYRSYSPAKAFEEGYTKL